MTVPLAAVPTPCACVHTRVVCMCMGVPWCLLCAPAWDTALARGDHTYTSCSAPSSGKLGSFFLEPMPCGSNPCFSAHSWS